jgi:hypothetical protein
MMAGGPGTTGLSQGRAVAGTLEDCAGGRRSRGPKFGRVPSLPVPVSDGGARLPLC